MNAPRMRVILDNDYSGDPDGLFQLAHHVLSTSVDIRLIIGSHLRRGDPFDPSETTADNAAARASEVLDALGTLQGETRQPVLAGTNTGLLDAKVPIRSRAALAIVAEAMREDTKLPLFIACGAGLTEIASAWLIEPRIAERITLVWIGGVEYPGLAIAPPGASAVEYNLNIDPIAAQVIFNDSDIPLWQIPRDAYRQTLLSSAELVTRVRPYGEVGELLFQSIERVMEMAGSLNFSLGETYIYGDSPLVLLTALQSSFEADPSSSEYVIRPAPTIGADGLAVFENTGRNIRIYTRLDTRLMFEDFFAKLRRAAGM